MAMRYEGGSPVSISIGSSASVELPPRVFRGRLVGMLFDHDKTFLLPSALRGIRELKKYYDEHPQLEVLVVGHTDSTGDTGYNVSLSQERAKVIAAFLRDEVEAWLAHYQAGPPGKTWGTREDQHMLAHLAGYDGNLDGKAGARTKEAVLGFQEEQGIAGSGKLDPATRRALVTRYLAEDETTLPEGTQLVTHGAGPHHPEEDGDSDEARRRNRRVEIFLSEGPIEPPPGAPDGPEYPEWVRKSSETVDFSDAPEEVVEVDLEWPGELVAALPDDFRLKLSGPEISDQVKEKSAGVKDGDLVRFEFRWIEKSRRVDLEASGGGKTVQLWREQVAGDLETEPVWEGELDELVGSAEDEDEDEPAEVTDEAIDAGHIPDDLRAEELAAIDRGLA
jgi:outer membrane protein OmpA-like peptidoglycan-associated protein